jgi:hypothetical protein
MATRRALTLAFGTMLGAFGLLGAISGSSGGMIILFAGLILLAVGVDRS